MNVDNILEKSLERIKNRSPHRLEYFKSISKEEHLKRIFNAITTNADSRERFLNFLHERYPEIKID